ncbi:hypothetical protein ABTX85_08795 [Streptomyces sp. NPDC096097]
METGFLWFVLEIARSTNGDFAARDMVDTLNGSFYRRSDGQRPYTE